MTLLQSIGLITMLFTIWASVQGTTPDNTTVALRFAMFSLGALIFFIGAYFEDKTT